MTAEQHDTQAQRMPTGKPESEGLANSPLDTSIGVVKPLDGGPLDRAGTEAEANEGMTNEPIPLPGDEPEVGLTGRLDD